jgi:deazaflavin-dependent oxidoreductase (nitroreductase family)
MSEQEVVDSPTPFVADHIKSYVESDGADGHDWQGVSTLLLTTTGRKSGVLRRSALIYGRDGDDLVIVASKGGADDHPAWYLNLVSDPAVRVQVGAEQFDATATTADPSERARLWPLMAAIWPDYDQYATKTDREIPVVVLKRA